MRIFAIRAGMIGFIAAIHQPCQAQDMLFRSDDGGLMLSGGLGLAYLSASEYVYDGSFKDSQLDYRTKSLPVYSTSLSAALPAGFTLHATADLGLGAGKGLLTDYDWNDPFYVDQSKTGWSDRSISPDTKNDHYWNGSVDIGHSIYARQGGQIEAIGGFRYTDVKWTAYGGSYVYSDSALRDDIGTFPAGEKGISYQQKVPVAYLGLNGNQQVGKLTFTGGLNGGMSFGIRDIDNHWLSDLLYHDDMRCAPAVMANIGADYAVTPASAIYVAGSFEKIFNARGDTRTTDTDSGETELDRNIAGGRFQSLLIKFGVKGQF